MRDVLVPAAEWARFAMTDKRSPEELAGHDPLLWDALSERGAEQPSEPAPAPQHQPVGTATPFRFQVRTVPPGWLQSALGVFRRATPAGGVGKVKKSTLPGIGRQELTPAAPAATPTTTIVDDPQRDIETTRTPTLVRRARQRKQLAIAGVVLLLVLAVAIWLTPPPPSSSDAPRAAGPEPGTALAPATAIAPAAAPVDPARAQPATAEPGPAEPAESPRAQATPAEPARAGATPAEPEPTTPAPRAAARAPAATGTNAKPTRSAASPRPRASSAARGKKSQDPDRPFF